jgi:hypothetical protein
MFVIWQRKEKRSNHLQQARVAHPASALHTTLSKGLATTTASIAAPTLAPANARQVLEATHASFSPIAQWQCVWVAMRMGGNAYGWDWSYRPSCAAAAAEQLLPPPATSCPLLRRRSPLSCPSVCHHNHAIHCSPQPPFPSLRSRHRRHSSRNRTRPTPTAPSSPSPVHTPVACPPCSLLLLQSSN